LLQWDRLRNGRPLPLLRELDLDGRNHDVGQLSFCSVETDNGKSRYHTCCARARIWFPSTIRIGPENISMRSFQITSKSSVLAALDHCRECACCVYTVSSGADATGKMVDCERLLLPFGTGVAVTHILTSLQLISIEGGFTRQNIFGNISRPV
jgi:hypothetical protein